MDTSIPRMPGKALNLDPMDELRLVTEPPPDRLPAMLFLAALFHGILIIGISFNPELLDEFAEAISLEVTIVAETDQHIDRPDEAEYLAQASQEGGGNTTEQVRPSAPRKTESPIDNPGEENGDSFMQSANHERAADELLATQRPTDVQLPNDPRKEPLPDDRIAMSLEKGSEATLPLPEEPTATLQIHDDDPRQLIVSADTSESNVAMYLDNWKRRIEAVGDEYFPQVGGLEGLEGSPTLEVAIASSGELSEVVIRKSSGSAVIDKAALDILRRASPFDPFPAEIRDDYDTLRFAYKWLFGEDVGTKTARLEP
ncbi:MAG: TonB family protein [Woeseiaceae bacterium]|nr:TonB family protein [Woeseiaceae bacterium]